MKRILSLLAAAAVAGLQVNAATIKTDNGSVRVRDDVEDLEFTDLSRITFPKGLTNLRTLRFYDNRLKGLTLPSDMVNLRELDVSLNWGNLSLDFPIAPNLRSLSIGRIWESEGIITGNRKRGFLFIPSWSDWSGMRNLEHLELYNCRFTDSFLESSTVLEGLTNLRTLRLHKTNLRNLTIPSDMVNLRELDVSLNPVRRLTLPSKMSNLKYLNCYAVYLTLPSKMSNLEHLVINSVRNSSFKLPSGMSNLRQLSLWNCGLDSSFKLPSGMINLEHLNLAQNNLGRLELPKDLAKNVVRAPTFMLVVEAARSIEPPNGYGLRQLAVHYEMERFRLKDVVSEKILSIPAAKDWIKNKSPDSDGVFRFKVSPPIFDEFEVYGKPFITIRRGEDSAEIVWKNGRLQSAPTINGPWKSIATKREGTLHSFFGFSSPKFFRLKP